MTHFFSYMWTKLVVKKKASQYERKIDRIMVGSKINFTFGERPTRTFELYLGLISCTLNAVVPTHVQD